MGKVTNSRGRVQADAIQRIGFRNDQPTLAAEVLLLLCGVTGDSSTISRRGKQEVFSRRTVVTASETLAVTGLRRQRTMIPNRSIGTSGARPARETASVLLPPM